MLTDEQIDDLRGAVMRAQARADKGRETVRCVGGPLHGLVVRINPCYSFGWVQRTERGIVVASYKHGERPGEWAFEGYSRPGREQRTGLAPRALRPTEYTPQVPRRSGRPTVSSLICGPPRPLYSSPAPRNMPFKAGMSGRHRPESRDGPCAAAVIYRHPNAPRRLETGLLPNRELSQLQGSQMIACQTPCAVAVIAMCLPRGNLLASRHQMSDASTSRARRWISAVAAVAVLVLSPLLATTGCTLCELRLRESGELPPGVAGVFYEANIGPGLTGSTAVVESTEIDAAGGPLPPGLSLSVTDITPPGGDPAFRTSISGTPQQEGTFTFTVIQRGRCFGRDEEQAIETYTIRIEPPCAPLATDLDTVERVPDGEVGLPYSFRFLVQSSQGLPTWFGSGPLPPGLSLRADGLISGTPEVAGTFDVDIFVSDDCPNDPRSAFQFRIQDRTYALTIHPPGAPGLNCRPLEIDDLTVPPNGSVNRAYSGFIFAATSSEGAVAWSTVVGSLPPGLVLSPAGVLTGTPVQEGTFNFTVRASDSCPRPQTEDVFASIVIGPTPTCLALDMAPAPAPPTGTVGVNYLFQPSIIGGDGQRVLTVASGSPGPLPPGLSINGLAVQGTPTAEGQFEVILAVTDTCPLGAQTDTTQFTFTINPGGCPRLDVVAGIQPPQIQLGGSFNFMIPVTGGVAPITLQISDQSGPLPPGCTFDGERISGTPTATGVFQVLVEGRDSCAGGAQFDAEFFDFVVNP